MKTQLICSLLLTLFHIGLHAQSERKPYLVPTSDGVRLHGLVSVGELFSHSDGGKAYYLEGTPDGTAAIKRTDNQFTLYVCHELGAASGVMRAHGAKGAFVSQWEIRVDLNQPEPFRIISGKDAITQTYAWDAETGRHVAQPLAMARLCSMNLAEPSAYRYGDLGTDARILLVGEEHIATGRAFAIFLSGDERGNAYQLPWVGRMMFETIVACPVPQETTLVMALDDFIDGQVYCYIGRKQARGNELERAGLKGGQLFGIKVQGFRDELDKGGAMDGARFSLEALNHSHDMDSNTFNAMADAAGVTRFVRPEDGHWDTQHPGHFYFVTTGRDIDTGNYPARLFRLEFDDIREPERGGTVRVLLSEFDHDFIDLDNITVDYRGDVWLQEDPGADAALCRIFRYRPSTGELTNIAQADPAIFRSGTQTYLTTNEASSGIIDLSAVVAPGYYAISFQSHASLDDPNSASDQLSRKLVGISAERGKAAVEDGQLMLLKVDD